MPQRQASEQSFDPVGKKLSQPIPLSLFSAPNMPQRQESASTLGSRQSSVSTLSTQDSYRSLDRSLQPMDSVRSWSVPEAIEEEPKEFTINSDDCDSSYSPQDVVFGDKKPKGRRPSFARQETRLMSRNQQMSAFLQQGKYPSAYAETIPIQSLPVQ